MKPKECIEESRPYLFVYYHIPSSHTPWYFALYESHFHHLFIFYLHHSTDVNRKRKLGSAHAFNSEAKLQLLDLNSKTDRQSRQRLNYCMTIKTVQFTKTCTFDYDASSYILGSRGPEGWGGSCILVVDIVILCCFPIDYRDHVCLAGQLKSMVPYNFWFRI